jgi:hypothetical protein
MTIVFSRCTRPCHLTIFKSSQLLFPVEGFMVWRLGFWNVVISVNFCGVFVHHNLDAQLTIEIDGEIAQEPQAPVPQIYEFAVPGSNGGPPASAPLVFLAENPVPAFEMPQVCCYV